MDFILKYYAHPYVFFVIFSMLIIYNIVHQYRSDSIIKDNNLDLSVLNKIFLFRIPFFNIKYDIDNSVLLKIKKLAKEYLIINIILISYFVLGVLIFGG